MRILTPKILNMFDEENINYQCIVINGVLFLVNEPCQEKKVNDYVIDSKINFIKSCRESNLYEKMALARL